MFYPSQQDDCSPELGKRGSVPNADEVAFRTAQTPGNGVRAKSKGKYYDRHYDFSQRNRRARPHTKEMNRRMSEAYGASPGEITGGYQLEGTKQVRTDVLSQSIGSSPRSMQYRSKRMTDGTSIHALEMAMSQYLNSTGAGDYDLPVLTGEKMVESKRRNVPTYSI